MFRVNCRGYVAVQHAVLEKTIVSVFQTKIHFVSVQCKDGQLSTGHVWGVVSANSGEWAGKNVVMYFGDGAGRTLGRHRKHAVLSDEDSQSQHLAWLSCIHSMLRHSLQLIHPPAMAFPPDSRLTIFWQHTVNTQTLLIRQMTTALFTYHSCPQSHRDHVSYCGGENVQFRHDNIPEMRGTN